MKRSFAFLLVYFLLSGAFASEDGVQTLLLKKFDNIVAQKIADARPDIVSEMQSGIHQGGSAILVYRGLAVPPEQFEPHKSSEGFGDDIYVSKRREVALDYTFKNTEGLIYYRTHPTYGTLIEYQVPDYFFQQKEFYQEGNVGTMEGAQLQDQGVFIRRIGRVKFYGQHPFSSSDVTWSEYKPR